MAYRDAYKSIEWSIEQRKHKSLVSRWRKLLMDLNLRQWMLSALFIALFLFLNSAQAQIRCEDLFKEFPRPATATITDKVAKNNFITDRTLWDYTHDLHPDFAKALERMTPESHWIDMGAGKAKALIEFMKSRDSENRPFTTAVAFKIDRWFGMPTFEGKLQTHEGLFEHQPTNQWRKADVITDVMGVFSYTTDLSTTLQKNFDLLKVNGELYISTSAYGSQFRVNGETLSLEAFLTLIPGLKVEGKWGNIKITKEQENIKIPVLELERYKDESPPIRLFKVHFDN
ncbi:hypothetical protein ACES2L_07365 [Bdellovibrio bacteriovorus]